jgi:hypothetical protein
MKQLNRNMETQSYEQAKKFEEEQRAHYRAHVLPKHLALINKHQIPHKILSPKHYRLKVTVETRTYMVEYYPDSGMWEAPKTGAKGSGIPQMLRYFRIFDKPKRPKRRK